MQVFRIDLSVDSPQFSLLKTLPTPRPSAGMLVQGDTALATTSNPETGEQEDVVWNWKHGQSVFIPSTKKVSLLTMAHFQLLMRLFQSSGVSQLPKIEVSFGTMNSLPWIFTRYRQRVGGVLSVATSQGSICHLKLHKRWAPSHRFSSSPGTRRIRILS